MECQINILKRWKGAWSGWDSSNIQKSSDWQDINYEEYRLSGSEWLLYGGQGFIFVAVLSYIFYRSMAVFLAAIPLAVFWPVFFKRELKRRRLETLRIQFKDAILCVSSCLTAGYSVENAFAAALSEVERLYGKDSMIFGELRQIIHKTKLNQSFEEALENFAERSGIEDIRQFADVFLAARRSGGELMRIIAGTADIIGEKLRLQEEIITMTAAKKFEQKLMSGVPVLITLYIELTSPGFFQVLYETLIGRALMTVCLAVYLTACYTAWKILEIEV